jgi:hypothetical protein
VLFKRAQDRLALSMASGAGLEVELRDASERRARVFVEASTTGDILGAAPRTVHVRGQVAAQRVSLLVVEGRPELASEAAAAQRCGR